MRLVTYRTSDDRPTVGALTDDGDALVPLDRLGDRPGFDSMQELIDGGDGALDTVRDALAAAVDRVPLDDVTLLAPIPRPLQIRDMLCFLDHLRNVGRVAMQMRGADPESFEVEPAFVSAPRYYKANVMSVVGPEHEIEWPRGCSLLDFELELGIVIGRGGKDIRSDDALGHVFGYTIFNDVSARDLQLEEMPSGLGPAKGKDFDTGNVMGPCIATADAIDPLDVTMVARLNGEEIVRGSTSQMDHGVADAIAYASRNETLHAGEILGSGTVPLGCLMEHARSLTPGDLIELEVDGIGVLRNRVGERPPG